MKIRFQRTGGFANIPVRVELDGDKMPPAALEKLQQLLAPLLPFVQPNVKTTPDVHTYEISVETNDQEHVLTTNDLHITDELQNLFDFLLEQG